jgi:hypothetical protein
MPAKSRIPTNNLFIDQPPQSSCKLAAIIAITATFCNNRPIIGARKLEQVKNYLASIEAKLGQSHLEITGK